MPVLRSDGSMSSLEVDFSLALLSVLESAKKDPAQFRHMVYELARVQLEREARKEKQDGTSSVDVSEMPRLMLAFEAAIGHVERFSCEQEKVHCSPADLRALHSPDRAAEAALNQPDQPHQSSQAYQARKPYESYRPYELASYRCVPGERDDVPRPEFVERNSVSVINQSWNTRDARGLGGGPRSAGRNNIRSRAALLLRGFAVGFAVLLPLLLAYALFKPTSEMAPSARTSIVHVRRPAVAQTEATKSGPVLVAAAAPVLLQQSLSEVPISDKSVRSEGPSWPLPSVYGIYAVSDGKLIELEPLVGRVPDKVFMSSPISTPSRTQLADPRIGFIVFRRDIANSAPDRAPVRVIAKIRQTLKFTRTGKAETAKLDDVWTVRNISYDFRVAPMKENPEMLLLRPENPDFAFSPGRYALVLKGQAYDFTIAGEITETAHCLERTEAANGTFYSECKTLD
jgi:hypothetical protein